MVGILLLWTGCLYTIVALHCLFYLVFSLCASGWDGMLQRVSVSCDGHLASTIYLHDCDSF